MTHEGIPQVQEHIHPLPPQEPAGRAEAPPEFEARQHEQPYVARYGSVAHRGFGLRHPSAWARRREHDFNDAGSHLGNPDHRQF
jgi:hypothetical protein